MELNKKKFTVKGANIIYLISMLLLIGIGSIVQRWDFNYGILITEFILIATPPVLYGMINKVDLKSEFRFHKLSIKQIVLVFAIFISGYFVAVFFNLIGNIILSLFGEITAPPIPVASNTLEYIILLLIIAGSAGLCEEVLFRGLILRAYEKLGQWKSIMITSILFGMLHMNLQNFIGPTFLGFLLGFVVYKTNSIFAGMVGHFINNAISVTIQYTVMNLPIYKNAEFESVEANMTQSLMASAILFGILALIMGSFMILSMKALSKGNKVNLIEEEMVSMTTFLKDIKISWPIYITTIIFIIMSGYQMYLMIRSR